eukprot:3731455-Rhodomonas_salina.1
MLMLMLMLMLTLTLMLMLVMAARGPRQSVPRHQPGRPRARLAPRPPPMHHSHSYTCHDSCTTDAYAWKLERPIGTFELRDRSTHWWLQCRVDSVGMPQPSLAMTVTALPTACVSERGVGAVTATASPIAWTELRGRGGVEQGQCRSNASATSGGAWTSRSTSCRPGT